MEDLEGVKTDFVHIVVGEFDKLGNKMVEEVPALHLEVELMRGIFTNFL